MPIGHETSVVPGTVTCIFDKYEVTTLIQLKSPFINNTLTYCITQNIFVQESYSLPHILCFKILEDHIQTYGENIVIFFAG